MNQDRIAEIRARVNAATEGPWEVDRFTPPSFDSLPHPVEMVHVRGTLGQDAFDGDTSEDAEKARALIAAPVLLAEVRQYRAVENATFIAHAREDVPWLLAELEAAQKRAEAAEDVIQDFRDQADQHERRADRLAAELETKREALRDACDVAVWLTGIDMPEEAQAYWQDVARPKLHAALEVALAGGDPDVSGEGTMNGAEMIAAERQRHSEEGWDVAHDDYHDLGELAVAAICYARPRLARRYWPWGLEQFKPTPDDRVRELVKAGALIAAEIDRLLRAGGQT